MVGEVVCGLYDEVEVGVVVVFEDFGDVYGGVGVEVELVGVGLGSRVLRGCFLVSSLVPYGSYDLYAVLSMSMESQVMPVCRSSESISRPSASMSPQ